MIPFPQRIRPSLRATWCSCFPSPAAPLRQTPIGVAALSPSINLCSGDPHSSACSCPWHSRNMVAPPSCSGYSAAFLSALPPYPVVCFLHTARALILGSPGSLCVGCSATGSVYRVYHLQQKAPHVRTLPPVPTRCFTVFYLAPVVS